MWSDSIETLNPYEETKKSILREMNENKKSKYLYDGYDFSITKREVLFSVIILVVMLAIGFMISTAMSNASAEANEKYYLAMKITDEEQFQYGLDTSVGNALVYGDITAANPVSMPIIDGEYFFIRANYYRYTLHISYVNHYDEDGNITWIEEVRTYSWDYTGSDSNQTDSFTFMGNTFTNDLSGISSHELDLSKVCLDQNNILWNYYYNTGSTWDYVGNTRISYDAIPITVSGTIEAKLEDGTLTSFNGKDTIRFNENKTIDDVMKRVDDDDGGVLVFWLFWAFLTIGAIGGFYYIDNRWLD